ncbi:MAG: DUF5686 family protein [Bacteroidota bacterium]
MQHVICFLLRPLVGCLSFICLVFVFLFPIWATAQQTQVSGSILNASTKEPVGFANVFFQRSQRGTFSDSTGKFILVAPPNSPEDTLVISFIGYLTQKLPIERGKSQNLEVLLATQDLSLDEVLIVPPAYPIIRKVIDRKIKNDRRKFAFYDYEVYTKTELGLRNIPADAKKRGLLSPFGKVIDEFMDTTAANYYLPFFITETLSDVYYRKKPETKREHIKASKVAGTENESFSRLLGDIALGVNIYEDNIVLLVNKNFVSPIAKAGFRYYEYDLVDSVKSGIHWVYKIHFFPKQKQSNTFEGDLWIEQHTYAVKRVDMRMAIDANINYLTHFFIHQIYEEIEPDNWMPTKDSAYVEATVKVPPTMQALDFTAKRVSTYKDFTFNSPQEKEVYNSSQLTTIDPNALKRPDEYWEEARHSELANTEAEAYTIVSRAKELFFFRLLRTLARSYIDMGTWELGPIGSAYSFNNIEGHRIKFGARTRKLLGEKTSLEAYTAYGFRDQQIKYGASLSRILKSTPRSVLSASYFDDLELFGSTEIARDNILATVSGGGIGAQLAGLKEYRLGYEQEWFEGFYNQVEISRKELTPRGSDFDFIGNGGGDNRLVSTEVSLYTHFGWKERFLSNNFGRVSLGSTHPIFDARFTMGLDGPLDGEIDYQKLVLGVSHRISLGTLGYLRYRVEGGKIWGDVPFPFLFIPPGNETFVYLPNAYNTMDFFEFLADQYVSASLSYHMEGLLFNKVPLLRKLKLREVFSVRGIAGQLGTNNRNLDIRIPDVTNPLNKPFIEASVGIKNLLTLFRIDAAWRLTQRDLPSNRGFSVLVQMEFGF